MRTFFVKNDLKITCKKKHCRTLSKKKHSFLAFFFGYLCAVGGREPDETG